MSFDLFGMLEQSQATGLPFGGGVNSAGMADEQRNNDRGGNPRLPRPPRPQTTTSRQPTGFATPMIDTHALLAAGQAAQAQRMSKTTNDAIQDEMDRRVAISREQRRMAHELEKKRMDQEAERLRTEAVLKRLEQQSGITTIYH